MLHPLSAGTRATKYVSVAIVAFFLAAKFSSLVAGGGVMNGTLFCVYAADAPEDIRSSSINILLFMGPTPRISEKQPIGAFNIRTRLGLASPLLLAP